MSSSVVCAVDQSRGAERALAVANILRVRLGLRLVLAHAIPPHWPLDSEAEADAARRFVSALVRDLGIDDAVLRIELGSPPEVIARIASEERAELVVAASRGMGSFQAALLGSVSTQLVADAECPIVVVPPSGLPRRATTDSPTVVCGVDDSDRAQAVVACADMLASLLQARLIVAYVGPPPHWPGMAAVPGAAAEFQRIETEEAEAMLAGVLADTRTSSPTELRVGFGDAAGTLADLADEVDAEFLVVGSRGRGPAIASVLGSVSAKLIRSSRTPVVVVPPGVTSQAPL
jgi:nucleotide-binding universal stress UspA family protein